MIDKLRNFRKNRNEINILNQLIKDIESDMVTVRTSHLSHTPKSKQNNDYLEKLIDARKTLIERYCVLCNMLYKEQVEIERIIENLGQNERVLMRCYYLKGMTWEKTAEFMNLSTMQVYRIHKRVIECYMKSKI